MPPSTESVIVIGAGIGGLSAALRLAARGLSVTVFEASDAPGGKIRTLPSVAGPVDAGPTVLTLKPVFDALFQEIGEALEDHVTLTRLDILARHFWDDGMVLDLYADEARSLDAIGEAFGSQARHDFAGYSARARRLFAAFDGPMLQSGAPSQQALALRVLRQPRLLADMAPHRSLASALEAGVREPRLAQLFARYATYVGGTPARTPALLSLIWEAEARGVWAVDGGMQRLAQAIATLAESKGATFRYGEPVIRVVQQSGRAVAVETAAGQLTADAVLFNGDPRALRCGDLGPAPVESVSDASLEPRSLSAQVYAFAAEMNGPELAYHNVFFGHDPSAEFAALDRGTVPEDATLYLCAQDRAAGPARGVERIEIIRNAPPMSGGEEAIEKEKELCQRRVFDRLAAFGVVPDPFPRPDALTVPREFGALFPASLGSLYGRSPRGLTAGLKRPRARSALPGLYLCGGGAHPGAGVPMAALSGRHAAEAILTDLASTSTSRRTATRGGMSTVSPTTDGAASRSSGSSGRSSPPGTPGPGAATRRTTSA
ncbi:1-hydroxycarotenoid 3,4-desaturase CrtD [Histidinibacterium aquaticum]|uniref:FAD-dependent oxidoreductase n=1 Tax=Histidinibacterium aquaticum TaxID=2613962 RepID=A0A5J5GF96_9RHOB|nr:1-hydroxycarotenoid 3,4-desaturase CrtD [Histidinibacterium aquaticum]KAA9006845.1 FAD-dependent oxidoreductase [Histidinibacterium aquaticum]